MVASYHQWPKTRKALGMQTLLEDIAKTWFIQQIEEAKNNWTILKSLMLGNFAHHDSTQTALQQLETIKQQQHHPVTQFSIRLQQLLTRANPKINEAILLMATPTPGYILSSTQPRPQGISRSHPHCTTHWSNNTNRALDDLDIQRHFREAVQ